MEQELLAWIADGGMVVAASDRAARAVASFYHHCQLKAGKTAWPTPPVLSWRAFLQQIWNDQGRDGRLLLNTAQEEALWSRVAVASDALATSIDAAQHRIARMAMEAHERLCAYAPRSLAPATRRNWQQDAATFSAWLESFEALAEKQKVLSINRLPLEVPALLTTFTARPALLLAGFDRILPVQRKVFDAWGEWRELEAGRAANEVHFYAAREPREELTACALWCRKRLRDDPASRILVLTQNAASTEFRGEVERIFSRLLPGHGENSRQSFEFSLGVPLPQTALVRGAALTLRWLAGAVLQESEVDWLLAGGQIAASLQEKNALLGQMRLLRRRGQEQPEWTLKGFLQHPGNAALPGEWRERMSAAAARLTQFRKQSPLAWAETVPAALEAAGWPGGVALSSEEFQLLSSWQQAVENAGSLGFDGRRMSWQEFAAALQSIQSKTLFAPQSEAAPVLIAGPAEAAGLTADALWFLGADEENWPARGTPHPFLPLEVQREAGMPHASAQLDAELAETVTRRLLTSAPVVCFSYAQLKGEAELRPSRLVLQAAGTPTALPRELIAETDSAAGTVEFYDSSRVRFPGGDLPGGAGVLTAQSQCPFQAFAKARLGAQAWDPAQAGLTAAQRGQLLHTVLHSIWAGAPKGLSGLEDLLRVGDKTAFVADHVQAALESRLTAELRARMPERYLALEGQRLTRLIAAWLEFEAQRVPFTVYGREFERSITLAGLTLKLRLDRVDQLQDGTMLVIDYKTGNVTPRAWELPRPEDVQLPLYAGYALDRETEPLGGLAFAKIRAGKLEFAGRLADAKATLLPELRSTSSLLKNPLKLEDLDAWRECIEQLAEDFVQGKAEVDPQDTQTSCEHCGLESLCRILARPHLEETDDREEMEDE
jgi:probable DNA repair protein